MTDTIKECDDGQLVVAHDRPLATVVGADAAGVSRAALVRALSLPYESRDAATDEAALVERYGGLVRVVAAPRENLKVTTPLDLLVAEQLLAARELIESRRADRLPRPSASRRSRRDFAELDFERRRRALSRGG